MFVGGGDHTTSKTVPRWIENYLGLKCLLDFPSDT